MSAVNHEKSSIFSIAVLGNLWNRFTSQSVNVVIFSQKKTKSTEKIPAIFFMSIDLVNHINHSKTKISRALLNSGHSGHMQDNVIV